MAKARRAHASFYLLAKQKEDGPGVANTCSACEGMEDEEFWRVFVGGIYADLSSNEQEGHLYFENAKKKLN